MKIEQQIDCTHCHHVGTVTVITSNTPDSRSIEVKKCTRCNVQSGVKATLNRDIV